MKKQEKISKSIQEKKSEKKSNKIRPFADNIPYFKLGIAAICLALITYFTFSPALDNRMVSWDNESYLYNNPLVTSPSVTLIDIFSKPAVGNYAPLVIWSLRHDFNMNGLVQAPTSNSMAPSSSNTQMNLGSTPLYLGAGYISTDIWIHIFNVIVILLFWFFIRGRKELLEAILVALFFAIHPMHVETVAWIADRKDQLLALFYFLSLLSYVLHKQNENSKWWFPLTLLFFVLALLSKGTAVTLPVVLILIDLFFYNRKINWKLFTGKWLFFILSIGFGIITIFTQNDAKSIEAAHYPPLEHFMFGCYALVNYLFKWILPLPHYLSNYYPYPEKANGAYPWFVYASPFIAFALVIFSIWKFRTNKLVLFCILFFLVNIILLLQFLSVGDVVMADRYSYLSYLGLFAIAAILINSLWEKYKARGVIYRTMMIAALASYFLFLGYTSYNRSEVWFDNKSLWGDVKGKYPLLYLPYSQIGVSYEYENGGNMDSAYNYLTKSIELKPNADAYLNRANIFASRTKLDLAISDLSKAILLDPKHVMARGHRGLVYSMKGEMDSASIDFNETLRLSPTGASDACLQFGKSYNMHGMSDSAAAMFQRAVTLDPKNTEAAIELNKIVSSGKQQNELKKVGINYTGKISGNGKIISGSK